MIQESDLIIFCSEHEQVWRNKKGELHRLHGPVVIDRDGSQYWYKHGQWHRLGGPAVIFPDGRQYWYHNGKQVNQEDYPTVIYPDGSQYWYHNGKQVNQEEVK